MSDQVTVSKAEYDTLLAIRGMMDKAWQSKEKGTAFRRALKAAVPEARIPEEDADAIAAPVIAEVEKLKEDNKKLLERLDAKDKSDTDAKEEASLRKTLDEVKAKYNFDDEGIAKVVKRMSEKRNPDAEAAAAYVAGQMPKPQTIKEPGFAPQFADVKTVFGAADGDDKADMELLHSGDPWKFFDKTAAKILNEGAEAA